jgi:hypothetical protein
MASRRELERAETALAQQQHAVADAQAQMHLASQRVQVGLQRPKPSTLPSAKSSVNHFPQYLHLPRLLTFFDLSQPTQLGVMPLTWASLQTSQEPLLSLQVHLPSTWKGQDL